MKKIWHDEAWEEYACRQTQDKCYAIIGLEN